MGCKARGETKGMTADEARQKRAAEHHDAAMLDFDHADDSSKKGRLDLAILSLLSAAKSEYLAVMQIDMMETPHEPTRSIFYRSAATIARQASIALAEQGLRGSPDAQLRAELGELKK